MIHVHNVFEGVFDYAGLNGCNRLLPDSIVASPAMVCIQLGCRPNALKVVPDAWLVVEEQMALEVLDQLNSSCSSGTNASM